MRLKVLSKISEMGKGCWDFSLCLFTNRYSFNTINIRSLSRPKSSRSSEGLITWTGLARLVGLLRCGRDDFLPGITWAPVDGWCDEPRETGASLILVWRKANEPGWPGKRDYMEKSQLGEPGSRQRDTGISANRAGARFSKLPVITGPVKLFCFPFQMGVSKVLKVIQ